MKEGWEYNSLGNVCRIYNGNSINADYKKKHYQGLSEGYPFIATKDVSFNGSINYENGVRIPFDANLKIAYPKSVFICVEGGSAGRKIGLVEHKVCFGNKLFCLEPKNTIIGNFLYYYLKSDVFQSQFSERLTGLIGGVSSKKFSEIGIEYPSLSEQQSIVDYLESAFAKIDAMKPNAEKALNEAKALFQASLKEMLEPKEGWEKKKMGDIADFVRGPFGGSLTKAMFKSSGYAVYEQQHAIHKHINIRYFIDDAKFKEMERFSVKPGDLIMSCSGVTLGRINILPLNAPSGIINQALLKMSVKKTMNAHFFKYWLESIHFQKLIKKYSGGAAIPNVPAVKILKDIIISIPSLTIQQSIVATLDSLKSKVDRLQENYEKVSQECDALKQAILRQVFE